MTRPSSRLVGSLLLTALLISPYLSAGVQEKPRRPEWPKSVSADTIIAALDEADAVIISYGDNLSASTSDPALLAEFKRTLAGASLQPTQRCLCINTPQVTLSKGNIRIARLEFPHAQKLRISESSFDGDYLIGEDRARKLLALAGQLEAKATREISPVPPRDTKPARVEIRP